MVFLLYKPLSKLPPLPDVLQFGGAYPSSQWQWPKLLQTCKIFVCDIVLWNKSSCQTSQTTLCKNTDTRMYSLKFLAQAHILHKDVGIAWSSYHRSLFSSVLIFFDIFEICSLYDQSSSALLNNSIKLKEHFIHVSRVVF